MRFPPLNVSSVSYDMWLTPGTYGLSTRWYRPYVSPSWPHSEVPSWLAIVRPLYGPWRGNTSWPLTPTPLREPLGLPAVLGLPDVVTSSAAPHQKSQPSGWTCSSRGNSTAPNFSEPGLAAP